MTGDLVSLAERVERATGADTNAMRALGREVLLACGKGYVSPLYAWLNPVTSLDAAMSLVPEGQFHILWGHRSRSDTRPAATVGDEIGKHETSLTLALVSACLRSRAQESGQ